MKQWIKIVVVLVAFAATMNFIFEGLHVSLLDRVRANLTQPGVPTAVVIVLLLATDIFLPVPSSLVMVLSGVLFGTVTGGAISLIGSLAGNWGGFELMRHSGPRMFRRFVKEDEIRNMQPVVEQFGAVAIVLSRPVPIMMETLTLVAGLLRMNRVRFLTASLLGTVPITFLYAYAGSSSVAVNSTIPAIFILVCVPAIAWAFVQRKLMRAKRMPS